MDEKLAIEGGNSVRKTYLPYGHQWIDDEDIASVTEVLKSDWITQGPKVEEFERKVAEYCGAKYAVAVSSGTAALHAAMFALRIGPGDEVIVSPMTFAASANCVVYQGGTPIFADVDPVTLLIDPAEVEKKITPRTKAIIAVDYAGQPCDYDKLLLISQSHNIPLVADACHSLGAYYKGKPVGSLADLNVFSFHPVKHITTGEGGMVTTDNEEYARRMRMFRNHGITTDHRQREAQASWYYEMVELGYNYRITDFQCALGISQLKKLDRFVSRRREIATKYNEAFSEIEEIITPIENKNVKAAYHIYVIQLRTEILRAGRKEIFEALKAENIGANVHYMPLHLHPLYQREFGYKKGDYPKAERYYERTITLPIFPKMSNEDVEDVIEAVYKVIRYYRR